MADASATAPPTTVETAFGSHQTSGAETPAGSVDKPRRAGRLVAVAALALVLVGGIAYAVTSTSGGDDTASPTTSRPTPTTEAPDTAVVNTTPTAEEVATADIAGGFEALPQPGICENIVVTPACESPTSLIITCSDASSCKVQMYDDRAAVPMMQYSDGWRGSVQMPSDHTCGGPPVDVDVTLLITTQDALPVTDSPTGWMATSLNVVMEEASVVGACATPFSIHHEFFPVRADGVVPS